MAWFEDNSPCDYFGAEPASVLRAVGWLERGKPFSIGTVNRRIYEKLTELCKDPWEPIACAGSHACDLCQFAPEAHGAKNVFIPATGFLYVCPELILHFINAHKYAPPQEFCEAVLICP